jgi:hypothetical protein
MCDTGSVFLINQIICKRIERNICITYKSGFDNWIQWLSLEINDISYAHKNDSIGPHFHFILSYLCIFKPSIPKVADAHQRQIQYLLLLCIIQQLPVLTFDGSMNVLN